MNELIERLAALFSSNNDGPLVLPAAARDIDDADFPTGHQHASEKESLQDAWLVHLARKHEWDAQMGKYAPISSGGSKLGSVPLLDLGRLGNLVRRKIFTKSVVACERQQIALQFADMNDKEEVEDEEYIMVYIQVPGVRESVDFRGPYNYPFLERPLDKERDVYATFELVFNVKELTVAVPDDWEVSEKMDALVKQRERIKRQDEF